MKPVTVLLLAVMPLAPAKAADDIDFVRGCWATRAAPGGPVDGFLRLLPDRERGERLEGRAMAAYGDPPPVRLELSFARDGSALGLRRPAPGDKASEARLSARYLRVPQVGAALLPRPGGRIAAYARRGAKEWIVVKAYDERLLIQQLDAEGRVAASYFDGERDGCD